MQFEKNMNYDMAQHNEHKVLLKLLIESGRTTIPFTTFSTEVHNYFD